MVYCETIEESKTWVCPKSGIWKVICVGGGGAGKSRKVIGGSGGTTSFGSILSANGGAPGEDSKALGKMPSNGYNGVVNYGSENNTFYTGLGYGASGSGYSHNNTTYDRIGIPGSPGEVKSVIVDISEGTSIPCTIGLGGEGANGVDSNTVIKLYSCAGNNGAIVVQYLGENM